MNIKDIKTEAELEAAAFEINWDSLECPLYQKDFEDVMQMSRKFLPELESLYTKLTSGKSVRQPDTPTPLDFKEVEEYSGLVAEELYNAYVLASIYEKYTRIQSITRLANIGEVNG